MQLYSFFNSSTSYRVRIVLGLKGLPYDYLPVNIRALQHQESEYVDAVNPSACVPAIADGDFRLGQSMAIIDWLDARYPVPRMIPEELHQRSRVLELANLIGSDIHPVNNLRVLRYLETVLKVSPEQKSAWYRHWIDEGMRGVERLLERHGHGVYCFGDAPTLADVCLVPQMANAMRMGCDLSVYPHALQVYEHASLHPAFAAAVPSQQPDYIA
ncbi:maleylacetoacetate isomerase [Cupriavidus plantarum]|uniref:Maleylacetoacetate isomerase n=1 Tax=Cupriavidus plantarum TaxID=942865 RepID=A0A316F191_9BURK|nr:maleylacetoacetate isomerase [Cupriavidus plantarum]NYI00157.1 maleylacetoacetate isomerase [Cupriavidus plantarum]PWK37339.1 maleylacetoacetate isomerase [Cupriavidus plantarum]REF01917.1 maleylacetoacetate isomerase [Cupriavidus plantarum]RLK45231.1 maleylacetoacetate isomerase [Cupriavidus plantarum]